MLKLQKGVGNDRLQFTANNERAVQTLKPSSAQKKCFEKIPCDFFLLKRYAFKFAHWFSSVFQSLEMHSHVSCNLADSSRLLASEKKNQKIMISTAKN